MKAPPCTRFTRFQLSEARKTWKPNTRPEVQPVNSQRDAPKITQYVGPAKLVVSLVGTTSPRQDSAHRARRGPIRIYYDNEQTWWGETCRRSYDDLRRHRLCLEGSRVRDLASPLTMQLHYMSLASCEWRSVCRDASSPGGSYTSPAACHLTRSAGGVKCRASAALTPVTRCFTVAHQPAASQLHTPRPLWPDQTLVEEFPREEMILAAAPGRCHHIVTHCLIGFLRYKHQEFSLWVGVGLGVAGPLYNWYVLGRGEIWPVAVVGLEPTTSSLAGGRCVSGHARLVPTAGQPKSPRSGATVLSFGNGWKPLFRSLTSRPPARRKHSCEHNTRRLTTAANHHSARVEGTGAAVVRLLASHLGEPGSIPGGLSRVGSVPDDAADRRVFSEVSSVSPAVSPRFTVIGTLKAIMLRAAGSLHSLIPSLSRVLYDRLDVQRQKLWIPAKGRYTPGKDLLLQLKTSRELKYDSPCCAENEAERGTMPNWSTVAWKPANSDSCITVNAQSTWDYRCETVSYSADSSRTRQQNCVTCHHYIRTPFADQSLLTASQKQSSDTHKTLYDRVKRCRERKINIKASERVNPIRLEDHFQSFEWPIGEVVRYHQRSRHAMLSYVLIPTLCLHRFYPFLAEKRGSYKGHTGTHYKSAIASTRRALNWRAVFS
ncbi:hypothetical protein PR048_024416 [Dryococelus australis]|uniref:SRCR domain-containing protein n=1 Tax=Dryococelus australis TaxID=614101 RepID=A0ABQ9GNJ9_9NEOP|nr:hypothetical protein PR048_024416 [Dryococelus australis]